MEKKLSTVLLGVGIFIGLTLGWVLFSGSFSITGNAKAVITDGVLNNNADACSADSVCETNKLSTYELYSENGIIEINQTYFKGHIGYLITNQNENVNIAYLKDNVVTSMFNSRIYNNNSIISIVPNYLELGNKNDFENTTVQFGDLNGESNAYACLSSEGVLYRSSTPCN